MRLVEDFKWDWERGEHNHIPKCCRVWFLVRSRIRWHLVIDYTYFYARFWRKITKARYVRCPICMFRGRYIEVHICTRERCEGQPGAKYFGKTPKEIRQLHGLWED